MRPRKTRPGRDRRDGPLLRCDPRVLIVVAGIPVILSRVFRQPDGSTISISGVARGRDGRPGERVLGSGAAGSVATSAGAALISEAGGKMAEAAGDALGSEALREAGSNAGDKARRLDPVENVVIAKRNTSFVVYVEQVR